MRRFKLTLPAWKKAVAPTLLAAATALTLVGCDNREDFVFTNTALVVPGTAPTAVADQYAGLGNTTINVNAAQGVLANDSDVAGATVAVVTQPNSGTLTLNQDGSFSYTPPSGTVGSQTFAYSVTNQFGSSQAQVTIDFTQRAWFVDNSGAAGDGSQGSPFATLKSAETASVDGDVIFVFEGDGTDAGQDEGIVLKPNQTLLSERVGLIFQNGSLARHDISAQLVPNQVIIPSDPNARPVISNSTGPGVELAENNTVRGFQIENTAEEGMVANNATLAPGHTIIDNVLSNPGAGFPGIGLTGVSGTTLVQQNTFTGVDTAAFALAISSGFNATDNPSITIDGNTFQDGAADDPGSAAFMRVDGFGPTLTSGTPSLSFTFTNNQVTGETGTGFDNALVFGGPLDDFELGAGVTGQLNATIDSNTINGTDGIGVLVDFAGGTMLAGSVDLALSIDGNTFDNTGDEAIEVYLESKTDTTGTISGNTKSGGDGGGIDLRPGRDSTHETSSNLVIAQNNFTAIGSGERGIQILADGDTGQNTIFCIDNTITDDGDAISGYRIRSRNDAGLTVVSDGDTVSGFAQEGLIATALNTSTLLLGIRDGNFMGGAAEGLFMEGVDTGATICAQVLRNTFDVFRIRQNAGQNPLVQLEALPATTTLDTNTGTITIESGVTSVNLDACGIPATPTL